MISVWGLSWSPEALPHQFHHCRDVSKNSCSGRRWTQNDTHKEHVHAELLSYWVELDSIALLCCAFRLEINSANTIISWPTSWMQEVVDGMSKFEAWKCIHYDHLSLIFRLCTSRSEFSCLEHECEIDGEFLLLIDAYFLCIQICSKL